MKKVLVFILFPFFCSAQKQDTTKKYIIKLTETEYRVLQSKLVEAAQYEADLQRQKTLEGYDNFFKENIQVIPPKDTVGTK